MLWIFLKVGVDTGVLYVSINWAAEESQLEPVIAIIYVLITRSHAYIINQNERLPGKVSAVPQVCITSHKIWDYPLKAPYILFPFVVIKENNTSDLKLFFFFTQLKCDIAIEIMSISLIMILLLTYIWTCDLLFLFSKKTVLQQSNVIPFHLKNNWGKKEMPPWKRGGLWRGHDNYLQKLKGCYIQEGLALFCVALENRNINSCLKL